MSYFHPEPWGNDPIYNLTSIFFKWVVQPPTRHLLHPWIVFFQDFFDANGDLSLALSVRALADRFCIMDLLQRTEATLKYMLSEDFQ